jgi:hypothetical protein
VMLRPTTPAERRASGAWWTRQLIGPHHAARKKNPDFWRLQLPEPETFDFDDVFWKKESVLYALFDRATRASSTEELLPTLCDPVAGGRGLRSEDVTRFFGEFLGVARAEHGADWSELAATRAALQARYTSLELRSFERILGRFAFALEARLEAIFVSSEPLRTTLPTHYHRALFTHHLVRHGKAVVDEVLANPERAEGYAAAFTLEAGLYLFALFRLPNLVWEAHKVRLLDTVLARASERFPDSDRAAFERGIENSAKKVWGATYVTPLLRRYFKQPEYCDGTPENYPEFIEQPNGQIVPSSSTELTRA